jgi:hypothetical protein
MFSDSTQRLCSDGEKYYYYCRELIYSVAYNTYCRYTHPRNERETTRGIVLWDLFCVQQLIIVRIYVKLKYF